ncbi:MAG TPA: thioredoxin family protein [Pseudolabrys sp.]|nr:thioredoxin family protein [Pseudolabrys sp.]
MTEHTVASREDWLKQRITLLEAEKELTRHSDRVAQLRRQLPWVKIEKDYVFEGRDGHEKLSDLFDGRSQLVVQHFMLAPGWEEGCKSCSYMADHTDGMVPHLAQRDVTFVAISRAPYEEIVPFKRRMGWTFKWLSSNGTSFNYDFRVSFTPDEIAKGAPVYNFGTSPFVRDELPGVSVFVKDGKGDVFHTYSTYGRGVEAMMGTYRMLDLTPQGRDEEGLSFTMAWLRHHDRYDGGTTNVASCCGAQDRG